MLKMTMVRRASLIGLALAATLGSANSADALLLTFSVQSGSQGEFGYSGLHSATGCDHMCGEPLSDLQGKFLMDLEGSTFDVVGSSILLGKVVSTRAGSAQWMLEVNGGSFDRSTGGGYLDYQLSLGERTSTGTFIFEPSIVSGPANSISHNQFYLWGFSPDTEFGDLGIDLGGVARPVPEPSAALIFAVGACALGRGVRRRR